MRVCLISYEFPPEIGGEATYAQALASGLASLGHEVSVLVPDKPRAGYGSDPRFEVLRVKSSSLPMLKVASFVAAVSGALPRFVRENKIDLVHFTFDYPSFPPMVGGVGAPVLATVHHLHMAEALAKVNAGLSLARGLRSIYRDFTLSLVEALFVRRATTVIAVSAFTKKSLEGYLGIPSEKIRVVHNGIGLADLLGARDEGVVRGKFRLGSGPLLLYVGRLERSKGLESLLEAFADAEKSVPSVRLVIVGEGKKGFAEGLMRSAKSLGLERSVIFTGRVSRSDLVELYASSTALVLPSLMEGFGISLIEAMAAGKPCIATRVGAVPEVVREGITGLIVPPGEPALLASSIVQVLGSQGESALMGERGRDLVIREFTIEKMAQATAAAYEGLQVRNEGDSRSRARQAKRVAST